MGYLKTTYFVTLLRSTDDYSLSQFIKLQKAKAIKNKAESDTNKNTPTIIYLLILLLY